MATTGTQVTTEGVRQWRAVIARADWAFEGGRYEECADLLESIPEEYRPRRLATDVIRSMIGKPRTEALAIAMKAHLAEVAS